MTSAVTRARTALGLLTAAAFPTLTLGACHSCYPYALSFHDAATDAGDAVTDAAAEQRPPARDGPAADGDSGQPCTTYDDEPPLARERAACSCAGDCDGLDGLAQRDPEDGTCNALIVEESFREAADPRWLTHGGDWQWRCGWLEQRATAASAQWSWARGETLEGVLAGAGNYVVEARVKLGAVLDPAHWEVGIVARYGAHAPGSVPEQFIACNLGFDGARWIYGDGRNMLHPDLQSEIASTEGWWAAWPLSNPALYDTSEGTVFLIQLYYQSRAFGSAAPASEGAMVHCRAFTASLQQGSESIFAIYTDPVTWERRVPPLGGTVGLRTFNRQASFDYVRVYSLLHQ